MGHELALQPLWLLLRQIRWSASSRTPIHYMRYTGYVEALYHSGVIDSEALERLNKLAMNAFMQWQFRYKLAPSKLH
ncbi:MAG: hypothetical protein GAK43_01501 [Stenotrophomonas maltophilia]|nr:MAG: hypothetical protein GAK43_01501 [Stenotrophomonas maltophilia]